MQRFKSLEMRAFPALLNQRESSAPIKRSEPLHNPPWDAKVWIGMGHKAPLTAHSSAIWQEHQRSGPTEAAPNQTAGVMQRLPQRALWIGMGCKAQDAAMVWLTRVFATRQTARDCRWTRRADACRGSLAPQSVASKLPTHSPGVKKPAFAGFFMTDYRFRSRISRGFRFESSGAPCRDLSRFHPWRDCGIWEPPWYPQ